MDYLTQKFIAFTKKLRDDLKKISGQIEAYATTQHAKQDKEQPNPKLPILVRLEPQTESDEERTRNSNYEIRDAERLGVENRGLLVAIAALIISSVVAGANILQWFETRKAVSLAAVSAKASEKSAAASEAGVQITKQSIETSIRQDQLDQRAWVGAKEFKGEINVAPKPSSFHVIYVNTGKTPAQNVHSVVGVDWRPPGLRPRITYSEADAGPSRLTAFPNTEVGGDNDITKFSMEQVQQIASGKLLIYLFGTVWYDDVYGNGHRTDYCGVMNASAAATEKPFIGCGFHNTAD